MRTSTFCFSTLASRRFELKVNFVSTNCLLFASDTSTHIHTHTYTYRRIGRKRKALDQSSTSPHAVCEVITRHEFVRTAFTQLRRVARKQITCLVFDFSPFTWLKAAGKAVRTRKYENRNIFPGRRWKTFSFSNKINFFFRWSHFGELSLIIFDGREKLFNTSYAQ